MWILTTRNRPAQCQEVLDACLATGVSTPGIVWMDGCDYGPLRLPEGWIARADPIHRNLGEILRACFANLPTLPWYGWMADDCPPCSAGWDTRLIAAAGRWGLAYPDDQWQRGVKERDGTPHVTSICCFGGELLRTMGFWALPEQIQMYLDDVWESVAVPLGLMRYCPEVVSEHRHFANGKRPPDSTDTREFKGVSFPQHDRDRYEAWLMSQDYTETLVRVREAMRA